MRTGYSKRTPKTALEPSKKPLRRSYEHAIHYRKIVQLGEFGSSYINLPKQLVELAQRRAMDKWRWLRGDVVSIGLTERGDILIQWIDERKRKQLSEGVISDVPEDDLPESRYTMEPVKRRRHK